MGQDWRNCTASLVLVAEINARWPKRDKTSDGTVGDAAHATRTSDHNPFIVVDSVGVVRARDIDVDGIDAGWLAEYLRRLGAAGDVRLSGGGYVIFNRRITAPDFSTWRAYAGVNPHTKHVHVSFSLGRAGFDSSATWGIASAATSSPAPTSGDDGDDDELNADQDRMLKEMHRELTTRLPDRVDYALLGQPEPARRAEDTAYGKVLNTEGRAYETRELVRAMRTDLTALQRLVESQQGAIEALARMAGQGGGSSAAEIKAAVAEALRENLVRVDVAVAGAERS